MNASYLPVAEWSGNRCGSRGHRANNIQVEDFTNAAQVEYRTAGSYQGAIEARYPEY